MKKKTSDTFYLCTICRNVSPTPSLQIPSWCSSCYEYSVKTFTKQELHDHMTELLAYIKNLEE